MLRAAASTCRRSAPACGLQVETPFRDTAEKAVLVDAPSDAGRAKIGVPSFASS